MAVPDWIEKASESEAKAKRQLSVIPVTWEATTIPELPESIISLPISANLGVTAEGSHQLSSSERKELWLLSRYHQTASR